MSAYDGDIDVTVFDDTIVTEEVSGATVDEKSGEFNVDEMFDVQGYMKKFIRFDKGVEWFTSMVRTGGKVEENGETLTAVQEKNNSTFGPDGTIKAREFTCPYCGKKVDMLLKNGYCSKMCASKAKAEKLQNKVSGAMENTLEVL